MSLQTAEEIHELMVSMIRDVHKGREENTPEFIERLAILAAERERELANA